MNRRIQGMGKQSLLKQIYLKRHGYFFLLPLFVGLAVFCYYPPISGLYHAFFDWNAINEGRFVGLGNFRELFGDRYFLESIPTMFKIMLPKLAIGIVIPLIVAEMIFCVKSGRARYFYRVAVLLPMVAPGVVGLLIWKFIYDAQNGPITALARYFSIIGPTDIIELLSSPQNVIPAIIFMGFPWVSGTSVLIYMSGLMNISNEIIESSRLDGANIMQRIFMIDLPNLMGQIKYFLIFGIIGGLQDYGVQIVLTKGGPGNATYVPGYYMYLKAFVSGRMGYACSLGTMLFAVILTFTIINFKFVRSDTSV
jgi:ABC-type sugar transport system permease subunit